MVAKNKRLRTKVQAKLKQQDQNQKNQSDQNEDVIIPQEDSNKAFLYQHKDTKKLKSLKKSNDFKSQILNKTNNSGGAASLDSGSISKSSLRRRKRKLRQELKPKLNDLLVTLEEEGLVENKQHNESGSTAKSSAVLNIVEIPPNPKHIKNINDAAPFIETKKNQPSLRNQRGAQLLQKTESKRFQQVLGNKGFQSNPFESIKQIIKMKK
ncbi:related to Ribosome biogenesis protein SLX9 [Saccharomycodes ludwigii]|uniref:Ribosome biogenesis protein SLX9 n=1 Tax=Saccharomycodes ludwigii TaxID=36035 RepID=A0A376BA56_9ASCO|nr:hypothetical protein SCDLUD_000517 [Saccharomycodes ludwigii]KAH3902922.1 hypothetical protein SCDLUD_000517 [Saccharomycodes ludwigii]SSD61010.1 related to Ribosome biogenesis protein SLX9 [Saccharomycodes ludwigii]